MVIADNEIPSVPGTMYLTETRTFLVHTQRALTALIGDLHSRGYSVGPIAVDGPERPTVYSAHRHFGMPSPKEDFTIEEAWHAPRLE